MKVCFVIPNFNFFKTHRADLVKELSAYYEIHVITDVSLTSKYEINKFSKGNITIHHLQSRNRSMNFNSYYAYLTNLKKKIDFLNLDYIFYTTLETSFFGALLKNFINIKKSFFLVTGMGLTFSNNKFKFQILRVIQKIVFKACALHDNYLFIFQNNDDLKLFTKHGFASKNHCLVIPGNGINRNQFPFFSRDFLQEPTFLFASRLLISKGVEEYLEAAKLLIEKKLSAKFLIAGKYDPKESDPISAKLFKALLNDNQVDYLGELSYEQMIEVFNNSSIFVLPSYGEGLPKVVLEAAATGLPLITTNVPGCRECVKHGCNGLLVEPGNIVELAEAMETLILNKSNLSMYSKNSHEMIKNHYSLELISREYLKLLN